MKIVLISGSSYTYGGFVFRHGVAYDVEDTKGKAMLKCVDDYEVRYFGTVAEAEAKGIVVTEDAVASRVTFAFQRDPKAPCAEAAREEMKAPAKEVTKTEAKVPAAKAKTEVPADAPAADGVKV